jgi:hypothetical protein
MQNLSANLARFGVFEVEPDVPLEPLGAQTQGSFELA